MEEDKMESLQEIFKELDQLMQKAKSVGVNIEVSSWRYGVERRELNKSYAIAKFTEPKSGTGPTPLGVNPPSILN